MVEVGTSFPREMDKGFNPRRKSRSDFEQRRKPSLLAIRYQFQEGHREVQVMMEKLSQWGNPILPKDIGMFRSSVDKATEGNERLQLLADTLLEVLYHQGATVEMQDVHDQLNQVRERLGRITQDHQETLSIERGAMSQNSFGSSRTHMTTSSMRRNQAMEELAASTARKQLDEQASQLELEASVEAEQLRLDSERKVEEHRRQAEQLTLEADNQAREQKRQVERSLVEAERQEVQIRLLGVRAVLEKKKVAERLRREAGRASLQAVIDTIDNEESAMECQHESSDKDPGTIRIGQAQGDLDLYHPLRRGSCREDDVGKNHWKDNPGQRTQDDELVGVANVTGGPLSHGGRYRGGEGFGARSKQSDCDQPGSSGTRGTGPTGATDGGIPSKSRMILSEQGATQKPGEILSTMTSRPFVFGHFNDRRPQGRTDRDNTGQVSFAPDDRHRGFGMPPFIREAPREREMVSASGIDTNRSLQMQVAISTGIQAGIKQILSTRRTHSPPALGRTPDVTGSTIGEVDGRANRPVVLTDSPGASPASNTIVGSPQGTVPPGDIPANPRAATERRLALAAIRGDMTVPRFNGRCRVTTFHD